MNTPDPALAELSHWKNRAEAAEARADKAEAACKELQTLLSFAEPTRMPAHLALDWHERRKRALAAVKE